MLIVSISWASANDTISRWDAFIYFADKIAQDIPDSYTYIDLQYAWLEESSSEWQALQKLVYLGLINNGKTNLWLSKNIDFYLFEGLAKNILDVEISSSISISEKKKTFISQSDLRSINSVLAQREEEVDPDNILPSDSKTSKILRDVYKTINSSHYDRSSITQEQLITGAIKWVADSVGDKYTTYFPPVESKSFNENAWIQWGDRVIAVDGKNITPENPVNEVVSWIKWPKGTQVNFTIRREWSTEDIIISVTRDTIIIKDVEYEKISQDTYYIQIKSFWNNVTKQFREALDEVVADTNIKKIIFDVRNNPGWYLDEVSYMLSYFVPEWEATAIIEYTDSKKEFISRWYDLLDASKYELVFLQNGWSASASEIMVGTMKDYFPDMTIIGEKSFGKGSVQSLKNYYDGSTLKYTTAKWFTWKTKTGIDGVWITPDIEIEIDLERLKNAQYDNQLEWAKRN